MARVLREEEKNMIENIVICICLIGIWFLLLWLVWVLVHIHNLMVRRL